MRGQPGSSGDWLVLGEGRKARLAAGPSRPGHETLDDLLGGPGGVPPPAPRPARSPRPNGRRWAALVAVLVAAGGLASVVALSVSSSSGGSVGRPSAGPGHSGGRSPVVTGPTSSAPSTPPTSSTPSTPPTPSTPSTPPTSSPGGAPVTISDWASTNQDDLETLSVDLASIQADTDDVVDSQDFSGFGTDCSDLASDASDASELPPLPDPSYQATWSSVLQEAPAVAADCSATVSQQSTALAERTSSEITTATANLQRLLALLPQPPPS